MLKRIAQAAAWFMAYFMLQNVISVILCVGKLFAVPDLMEQMTDPDKMMELIMNSMMATIIPALIVSSILYIVIYLIHCKVTHKRLDIITVDWTKILFFTGIAGVFNVISNVTVSGLVNLLPDSWVNALTESTGMVTTGQPFWMLVVCTGLLVPVMEELTFRYGIHNTLAKHNLLVAYIVSSVMFGIMHGNPIQIVYAALFGWLLAYVYTKTNNIWYPIIMHAVNNTCSLLTEYFPNLLSYIVVVAGGGALLAVTIYCTCPRVKQIFANTTNRSLDN